MQKLLIFLVIIFLIGLFFKSWLYYLRKKFTKHFEHTMHGREGMVNKGKMVKCSACSTYFPTAEAVEKKIGGKQLLFCSDECMKNYNKQ